MRLQILLALGLVAAACSGPAPSQLEAAQLVRPGHLTACIAPLGQPAAGYPRGPRGEQLAGELAGYNVDFARALAERLELRVAVSVTPFSGLLDAVTSHRCDVAVSSQNITSRRLEIVDFVPYTRARQRVLVAHGNPQRIATIEGLCGQLVSATTGSTHIDMVEGTGDFNGFGLSQACLADGQPPIEVHRFGSHEEAVQALLDGSVTAHLGNPNFAHRFPEQLTQSPATLPAARQGIAVAKDRPLLRGAVAAALTAMIDDGAYHAILVEHLGSDERARAGSIIGGDRETPRER